MESLLLVNDSGKIYCVRQYTGTNTSLQVFSKRKVFFCYRRMCQKRDNMVGTPMCLTEDHKLCMNLFSYNRICSCYAIAIQVDFRQNLRGSTPIMA